MPLALLGRLLLSIAGSFAFKILAALGITFASYASFTIATDSLITQLQLTYNSTAIDILLLLNLAGLGQAFGIILGAYLSRAARKSLEVFLTKIPT